MQSPVAAAAAAVVVAAVAAMQTMQFAPQSAAQSQSA
jgi:hypothetical protein